MPYYEAMYLVHPSVGDERLAEIIARYNQVVESAGGVVEHSGKWDRRRLAYPISKVQEATYVLMYFRATPQVPAELERLFRISDEVIRYLIVRHDKPPLVLTVPPSEEAVEVSTAKKVAAESEEGPEPTEVPEAEIEPTAQDEKEPAEEVSISTEEEQG